MSEGHGRHRLGSRIPQDPGQQRLPVPGAGLPVPGAGPPGPGTGSGGPSAIRLVWVYPDLLSTYGDRGNLLMLDRRARLRGIGVEIAEVNSDQRVPVDGDIYLLGGGEDLPQILAARRLAADGGLTGAMNRGAVIFAVCAGYQIVGTEFGGAEGEPVPGLGLIDISSGRGDRRGVGEITADVDPALGVHILHKLKREDDPVRFDTLLEEIRQDSSAWSLAELYETQAVIDPRHTRKELKALLKVYCGDGFVGQHALSNWPTSY